MTSAPRGGSAPSTHEVLSAPTRSGRRACPVIPIGGYPWGPWAPPEVILPRPDVTQTASRFCLFAPRRGKRHLVRERGVPGLLKHAYTQNPPDVGLLRVSPRGLRTTGLIIAGTCRRHLNLLIRKKNQKPNYQLAKAQIQGPMITSK